MRTVRQIIDLDFLPGVGLLLRLADQGLLPVLPPGGPGFLFSILELTPELLVLGMPVPEILALIR